MASLRPTIGGQSRIIINNGVINNYYQYNIYGSNIQSNVVNNINIGVQCACPICGEPFNGGRGNFINSGERKDYFDCRKCGSHKRDDY